jgi:hypothetical protein
MDANEKKAVDEMIASFDSKIMFANSCPLDNDQIEALTNTINALEKLRLVF